MGLFDIFTSKKMAKNLTEYLFENIREAGNKIDSARYYLKEISKHKGGSYEVPMKLRHYEETLNDINNAIMKLKSNIQNDKDLT